MRCAELHLCTSRATIERRILLCCRAGEESRACRASHLSNLWSMIISSGRRRQLTAERGGALSEDADPTIDHAETARRHHATAAPRILRTLDRFGELCLSGRRRWHHSADDGQAWSGPGA